MVKRKIEIGNFIKFLGTAGARFVMLKQLRASGGIWLSFEGTNILIDPGPGSLIRCLAARPRLDPTKLDAIILTHRHLDHSADANVMLEAMTEGGFKKKGTLFVPSDALNNDPIILSHLRSIIGNIELLKPLTHYQIGRIKFSTGMRHIHPVETYGLIFKLDKKTVSLISDTRYSQQIIKFYKANIVIINVVFYQERPEIDHLSLIDVEKVIWEIKPETLILTHFGMTMLRAKPHLLEQDLKKRLNTNIISAYDGMTVAVQ